MAEIVMKSESVKLNFLDGVEAPQKMTAEIRHVSMK